MLHTKAINKLFHNDTSHVALAAVREGSSGRAGTVRIGVPGLLPGRDQHLLYISLPSVEGNHPAALTGKRVPDACQVLVRGHVEHLPSRYLAVAL